MVVKRIGKKPGGPWFDNYKEFVLFEKGVKKICPDIKRRTFKDRSKKKVEYTLSINVPLYNVTRKVRIIFSTIPHLYPEIIVDGPAISPHRYSDNTLCVWYPWDEKEKRWLYSDGLLHLIALIQIHLYKEEWWRETSEWLGPEKEHGPKLDDCPRD